MNFIVYDIALLIMFAIFVSFFLYVRRKNLKREGLLFLYRTKLGIRLINYAGKKYKRTLKVLSYISICTGYILMAGMIYLVGKIVWIYVAYPAIVQQIKVPPVMPLVPYIPQVFKLDYLPPFYFVYWIIILAIIAITHEFAHGIFAVYNKIKIKTTGFGFFPFFLPVFLAAFVELDEKRMVKKKKFQQMAVLSAGTFANVLTTIFGFIILIIFFSFAFHPSGVVFDSYSMSVLETANVLSINGILANNLTYEELINRINETELNKIDTSDGKNYWLTKELVEEPSYREFFEEGYFVLYDDAPAIRAGLNGAIVSINNVSVNSIEELDKEIMKYPSGEKIWIKTLNNSGVKYFEITLGEKQFEAGKPLLGIGFYEQKKTGISGKILSFFSFFRKSHIYYQPDFGETSLFFYNLLLWLVLISISVALINMLPIGIFDGGRFFYLTILAVTKNERKAKKAFSLITYLFLFLFLLLIVLWIFSFTK